MVFEILGEDRRGYAPSYNPQSLCLFKRTSPPRKEHGAGNTTPAEQKLWLALRASQPEGVHFRRQHANALRPFRVGNYIVDFCTPRQKLIIELDGGHHLEQEAYDQERTEFLRSKGYRVLRFWNNEMLKDIHGVMSVILETLGQSAPTPD